MRTTAIILSVVLASAVHAQWEVPVPIVLNGAQPADRQVRGLADPASSTAAVSVDAARNSVTTYTTTTGGVLMQGALAPAPASYTAGMLITIVPATANDSAAQVDLNNLGARNVLKSGGLALDSADLMPGIPARLIYDGTNFHLLGNTYIPCPAGYHVGGREFCIEDSVRADTGWYAAQRICRDLDARLCTFGEWVFACRSNPSFIGTVLDYEWVDSAANNTNGVKRVGNGGDGTLEGTIGINCGHGGQAAADTGSERFRCCRHR